MLKKSVLLVLDRMMIGVELVLMSLPIEFFGAVIVRSGVAIIETDFHKAKNLIERVIRRLRKAR